MSPTTSEDRSNPPELSAEPDSALGTSQEPFQKEAHRHYQDSSFGQTRKASQDSSRNFSQGNHQQFPRQHYPEHIVRPSQDDLPERPQEGYQQPSPGPDQEYSSDHTQDSSPEHSPENSPEPGSDHGTATMADGKIEQTSAGDDSPAQPTSGNGAVAKANAKDPSRPRRKKARRACFACQRAHLTCGDERPCNRCIKRGLQNQCQDGVRKKAKYLHDAPNEALAPGYPSNYPVNGSPNHGTLSSSPTGHSSISVSQPESFPTADPSTSFSFDVSPTIRMGPPPPANVRVPDLSPPRTADANSNFRPVPQMQGLDNALNTTASPLGAAGSQSFDNLFDVNDLSMYNFNVADFNFGNHYGALEFGMLGHMSSLGAMNTSDVNTTDSVNTSATGTVSYDNSNDYASSFGFSQPFQSWQLIPNTNFASGNASNTWGSPNSGLDAYTAGEPAPSLTSASPQTQGMENTGHSPTAGSSQAAVVKQEQAPQSNLVHPNMAQHSQQAQKQPPNTKESAPTVMLRKRRNPSEVYSVVQAPYSYTQGFHSLIAFLQKRYPSKKVLRIAKALAKIRPSFIACNKTLNQDDLIFMEKCFQRTLCEYEDFVNHYGTPTLLCRRTGEIAAASKEFCMVTGWRKDVLIGKEANLNVNIGGSLSGAQTGTSSRGVATPRIPNFTVDPARPQPVFLAELLDEDSVVQFYEDFAEMAFGASRSSIPSVPCSLLKYKTKESVALRSSDNHPVDHGKPPGPDSESNKAGNLIRGDAAVGALGEKEGRLHCQMCWTVRRDVFDIPMLIVMNFLPVI